MGLIAKNVSGEDFQPCPIGNHIAICTGVVSVGKHENNFQPEKTPKNEVVIMWTLPNATREDGFPFVLTKTYTLSLHEKASLRKDLNAWRGKAFTEEELEGFNLLNILEKPCMTQVNHEVGKDGKNRAKIVSIASMIQGYPLPTLPSDYSFNIFDDDAPTWQAFEALPKWLKARIEKAVNWADIESEMNKTGTRLILESDIPDEAQLPF
jgi:hypothetical protein